MYKELFMLVTAIISQPAKAWKALAAKEEWGDRFLTRYLYPLIGLVTLAAFVGVLFTTKKFDTEIALKSAIKALIASFGGFYLAAYLLNELWKRYFKQEDNLKLCQRFTGYASALMFALNIVLSILPLSDFFFLRILLLYTVYIVWEGAGIYVEVEKSKRLSFVVTTSILIIVLPELISGALFIMMPGMRI